MCWGLRFDCFYVWSPCTFLIEDNTELFYTLYKWNVPPIQYEKRLRWSNSTREVDCPMFFLIDFNVPTLTPSRCWVQAPLELSENVTLLAFCRIKTGVVSKESLIDANNLGCIIYIQVVEWGGQDGTLWHLCLHFPSRRHFAFYRNSEFSLQQDWANEVNQTNLKFQFR
jgi:hypothetical protein